MLAIRACFRPIRSARNPNSKPPIPDASSVRVPNDPAVVLLMPRSRMSMASTSEYSIASKASSAHPIAAASSVRRCAAVACRISAMGPMAMGSASLADCKAYSRFLKPRALPPLEEVKIPARLLHVASDLVTQGIDRGELYFVAQAFVEADFNLSLRRQLEGMKI